MSSGVNVGPMGCGRGTGFHGSWTFLTKLLLPGAEGGACCDRHSNTFGLTCTNATIFLNWFAKSCVAFYVKFLCFFFIVKVHGKFWAVWFALLLQDVDECVTIMSSSSPNLKGNFLVVLLIYCLMQLFIYSLWGMLVNVENMISMWPFFLLAQQSSFLMAELLPDSLK